MIIDSNRIENDFLTEILSFIEKERIKMKMNYKSNFEKMFSSQRQHGKWKLPKYLPNVWMLLDEIHFWAKNTNFTIQGMVIT